MAFLKNIADSLMDRVLPNVAASIFPEEARKVSSFKEKLVDAKELYAESADSVKNTFGEFGGVGKTISTAKKQLKSGKFGTDKEWEDRFIDRKMMGGSNDGFGSSKSDDSALDELDSFDFGESDNSTTNNVSNSVQNNFSSDNTEEFQSISDRIVQGNNAVNTSVNIGSRISAEVGSRMVGLTSRISSDIATLASFHTTDTAEFHRASLEFFQVQTEVNSMLSDGFPRILTNVDFAIREREAKEAEKMRALMGDEEGGISSLLDPQRLMTKLTDDTMFNTIFDENISPIGMMLSKFSSDPLGVIVGSALGAGIGNMFATQIEFIKHQASTIEYRIQEILETWGNTTDESPLGFIKKAIGNLLKVDRDAHGSIDVGGYTNKDISFDVQTKKAVVDVIPMYLAKILKAINKSDDYDVYDYKTARFGGSKGMVNGLKKEVQDISEGNSFGGLGNTTDKFLATNENLAVEIKEKIRDELQKMSRMSNSSNTSLGNVSFSDDETTEEFNKLYQTLTQKERYEFENSFRKHKFESQRLKSKFEEELRFSGKDQSIILNNEDLAIEEEDETARISRRINPLNRRRGLNENGNDDSSQGDPTNDTSIRARIDAAGNLIRTRTTDDIINPLNNWLNEGADDSEEKLGFKEKLINKFTNKVIVPLKHKLIGTTIEEAKDTSLFKATSIFMNEKVLLPFKNLLVGEERAKELGFFKSISTRFEESIIIPLKQRLLGKETAFDIVKETSLWKAITQRVDNSILTPFKTIMLGKDTDLETIKNTSVWQSISKRMNESVLVPFKHILLGKDTDLTKVKETGLWKSISYRIDKSILTPFKGVLLGKDTDLETIKNTSVWQSISSRFDKSILFPFKKVLLGGNENKASKFSLLKSINHRLDRSVFMPLKTMLIGNDDRSKAEIARTSLFKSLKMGFTERVIEPLSGMLFGQDKRKLGFFKNLGDTMSPFFNKLLFGHEKASKNGFLANLKTEGKELWSSMWKGAKERFFSPAVNTFKEFFGPVLKEFSKTMGSEIKYFGSVILSKFGGTVQGSITDGIKTGASNLFKNVFGDETVDLLRKNIILPLQDLTKTLTDNMSKVFKFLLRLPLNFLKGITDTMKINRITSGRGNYSEEETQRLMNLKKSGKTFNFLDLGDTKQQDAALSELNSTSSKRDKASIFSRIFSSDAKRTPEEVVDNVTANPAERIANAKEAQDKEAQGLAPTSANMSNLKFSPAPKAENLIETKDNAIRAANEAKNSASNTVLSGSIDANTRAASLTTAASNSLIASNEILNVNLNENSRATTSIFREVGSKLSTLLSGNITGGDFTPSSNKTTALPSTHVSSEMANVATVHMNTKLAAILPLTTSISTTTSSIQRFLKDNLLGTSARVENIVRMMRKKNKKDLIDTSDTGKVKRSFLRNPLGWISDTITGTLGAVGSIVNGTVSTIGKVASALISIPGKIAGSVVGAATGAINGILSITKDIIEGSAKALKGVISGLGNIIGSLAENAGKLASGIVSVVTGAISGVGKFLGEVIGPLGKALGGLVSGITKGILPVIGAVSNGLSSLVNGIVAATEGLAKFTWGILAAVGRGLAKLTTGSSDGFSRGNGKGKINSRVFVTNFIDLLTLSRLTPMHVFVRGGTVKIEEPKARRVLRTTSFNDNIENRLSNAKKDASKKNGANGAEDGDGGLLDGGPITDALSTGVGTTAGMLVAKALTSAKGGLGSLAGMIATALGLNKLGAIFKKLGTAAFIAATQLPLIGNSVGKLARRLRRVPLVGPPMPPGPPGRLAAAATAIKGKAAGALTGAGAMASRAGGAVKNALTLPGRRPPLVGPPLPPAAATGMLGKVGGAALKVGKGVGLAGMISAGGGIAADLLFEEGSKANILTSAAADGAGLGAMVGSFVPVIGTAVGAAIGAALNVIRKAGPMLLDWVEKKFEKQIRSATDYFIEIPERLTMFVNTLPDRITAFTQAIPEKMEMFLASIPETIVNLFSGPEDSLVVDGNGNVAEKTPSILGRMFVAIGSGIGTLVRSIPKILVSLTEGIIKATISIGATAIMSVGNALVSGFASFSTLIAKTLEHTYLKVREQIGRIPGIGKSIGGISSEDYVDSVAKMQTKYSKQTQKIKDYSANLASTTTAGVKLATSWSFANKELTDVAMANTTRDKKAYYEAVKANPNSQKSAEADYNKRTNGKGSAFTSQKKEAEYRSSTAGNYAGAGMVNGENAKFMDGAGGNYSNSPLSRGDGWQNNRDVIMYASNAVGVDPILMAKIAAIESGFRPRVKAQGSSASGLYQFIDGTWAEVKAKHGRKFGIPTNARQTDPVANALLGAAHIRDNSEPIRKLTGGVTAQDIYMAHFLGSGGANKFLKGLKADPMQAGTNLVTAGAAKANSSIFFKNGQRRTARAVYAELGNRVNSAASKHGVNLEGMNSGTWQNSDGFAGGEGSQGNMNGGGGGAVDVENLEAKLMHADYFNKMVDIQSTMSSVYKAPPMKMDMQQIINDATSSGNGGGGMDNGGAWMNNEDEGNAVSHDIAGATTTPFVSNDYLNGLRVKGGINGQATGGGRVRQHTADFAKVIQGALGNELTHFSSFNDNFHKGRGGKHPEGNAIDFSIANPKNSRQVVKTLEAKAAEQGFQIKVLDEYVKPSKGATGGHIHISVTGRGKGSIPMAAPISSGNGGGGSSYTPPVMNAEVERLKAQYGTNSTVQVSPTVSEKIVTAGTSSPKVSKTSASSNLSSTTQLSASSINIDASTVNLNGKGISELVNSSTAQFNNVASTLETNENISLKLDENISHMSKFVNDNWDKNSSLGFMPNKSGSGELEKVFRGLTDTIDGTKDKFNTTYINEKTGETKFTPIVDASSIKDSADINKTLNIMTSRRVMTANDKFNEIFKEMNAISGFDTKVNLEHDNKKEAVNVSMEDNISTRENRNRAISATNTTNAPYVTVQDNGSEELKMHTALLKEIAMNTKKSAANTQDNFFTSDKNKTVVVKDGNSVDKTTEKLEARVAINQSYQDMKLDMDTFPTYIQPSRGAIAVSTGGNRA